MLKLVSIVFFCVVGFFALNLMFGCSPPVKQAETDSPTDQDDSESDFNCALPSCSGGDCCDAKDEDGKIDKQCDRWCSDNNYLNLSGKSADKCLSLNQNTVEKLVNIFTKTLGRSIEGRLEDLTKKEDIELICGAVKELDTELLDDVFDGYTTSTRATRALTWIASNKETIQIFKNVDAVDENEGVKLFKKLLSRAGDSDNNDDDGVLLGLANRKLKVDKNDDNNFHILSLADRVGNNELTQYIHEQIIMGEDEGICGADSNFPSPVTSQRVADYSSDYEEEPCVLGVYCRIAPRNDNTDNDFREEKAKTLKNANDVTDFIKTPTTEGGLTVTAGDYMLTEKEAKQWHYNACRNLKRYWEDGDLNLGL